MRIKSEIRGPGLVNGRASYYALTPNQPLLLIREPTNPVDCNAIIAATLFNESVGYVAREDAKLIAPQMDRGVLWLGKVTLPPLRGQRNCRALLWCEKPEEKTQVKTQQKKTA